MVNTPEARPCIERATVATSIDEVLRNGDDAAFMLELTAAFLAGVILSPVIRPMLRPLFVEAIKAGLVFSEEVKRVSAQVKEEVEDAAAEVAHERAAKAAADAARPEAAAPGATSPSSSAG